MNSDQTKSIKINEELHRQLRMLAAEYGCGLAELAELLIRQRLDNVGELRHMLETSRAARDA